MTSRWDASEVLDVDPHSAGFTCVGYAKTRGRRCRNVIAKANRDEAAKILQKMSGKDVHSASFDSKLESLANRLLCRRWHAGDSFQVELIVEEWESSIETFRDEEIELERRRKRRERREQREQREHEEERQERRERRRRREERKDREQQERRDLEQQEQDQHRARTDTPNTVTSPAATPCPVETVESLRHEITTLNERYANALLLAASSSVTSPQTNHRVGSDPPSPPAREDASAEISNDSTHHAATSLVEQAEPEPIRRTTMNNAPNVEEIHGIVNRPSTSLIEVDEQSPSNLLRKPVEGDCSICCDNLATGSGVLWCKTQCGQNFHADCVGIWFATQENGNLSRTCPYW